MAHITANTNEVEVLVQSFAQKGISGFTFALKDGKISVEKINLEGDAEFKGLTIGYSVKVSKSDGLDATLTLK